MKPIWQTNTFLGTFTERTSVSISLIAESADTYDLISGQVPVGLSLTVDGLLSGIPSGVGQKLSSEFVVRATNSAGVTDQNFIVDIQGTSDITWITPEGFIGAGIESQPYIINKTPVSYQFIATPGQVTGSLSSSAESLFNTLYLTTITNVDIGYPGVWRTITGPGIPEGTTVTSVSQTFNPDFNGYAVGISQATTEFIKSGQLITIYDNLPPGQQLQYFLTSSSVLPNGINLNTSGKLNGAVDETLPVLVTGGSAKPTPKTFEFGVIATNGVTSVSRQFKILVVYPDNLSVDTTVLLNSPLTVDASTVTPLFWSTKSNLGTIRDRNNHIIQLSVFDPYPTLSTAKYQVIAKAEQRWTPATRYQAGDLVVYVPGVFYFTGAWDPSTNTPQLANGDPQAVPKQQYIVDVTSEFNFGQGVEYYQKGDYVVYDGVKWNRIPSEENSYICIDSHISEIEFDTNKWTKNQFPPYFNLDPQSGALYASLPYIPQYRETYSFVVKYNKRDVFTGVESSAVKSFSLTIEGEVSNPLKFISSENLGTIGIGYPSELSVQARHQLNTIQPKFRLVGGRLPTGLELTAEGNITGQIVPGTIPGQYSFKIQASDYYQQTLEQGFYLLVEDFDLEDYYKVYATGFNQPAVTDRYSDLVNDLTVFKPEFIYRIDDQNFGIPSTPKVFINYGLEQVSPQLYQQSITGLNIARPIQLNIGQLVIYDAKDADQNVIYQVLAGSLVDVSGNVIDLVKQTLESITVNGREIKQDNYQAPSYTRTIQADTGTEPITELHLVLAYTLPGKAIEILKKLNKKGEKFIDFPLIFDRIVLENLKNSNDTIYTYLVNYH